MIKTLCQINGASGDEERVREFIIKEIEQYVSYEVDNLGNLICFKKGKNPRKNKLMVAAHMDEVAFIITNVNSDGKLHFATVGGIDAKVVYGAKVTTDDGVKGVVDTKSYHLKSNEERGTFPKVSDMLIDIGAKDKEDALKKVDIGQNLYFDSDYIEFGDGKIKAKALDDRIGCYMMINLIKSELEYDTYFAFTVQEEVGTRGALVATNNLNPDVAIVLEATTASDIADVTAENEICRQKQGAVISFMDRSTIYNKQLFDLFTKTATEEGNNVQVKCGVFGGNDAGAIHKSAGGVRTVAVSLPCRYIHSPNSVLDKIDIESTQKLITWAVNREL